jgi:mannose-6-phosphate isomerase-like protein (cupin superfamily)
MNSKPINTDTAEPYTWGDGCAGWRLVQLPELSVIEECMPPGTSEVLHLHHKADQFFYVLSGEAQMEVEGNVVLVKARSGIFIAHGTKHKIRNASKEDIQLLVISQPTTTGDRQELEGTEKR